MRACQAFRWTCLLLTATLLGAGWSCSWTFMHPPPADAPPEHKPDCGANGLERTDGMLSGIFAGLSLMNFGGYFLARTQEKTVLPPEVSLVTGSGYAVPALIFAASAITGAVWASRCTGQAERYLAWAEAAGHGPADSPGPAGRSAPPRESGLADGRPCPAGTQVFGDPPPLGQEQGCRGPGPDGSPVLQGPYAAWYESGSQASRGEYSEGRRHGSWTFWYESGIKKLQATYDRGRQVGHWIYWDKRGDIFREVDFDQASSDRP